MGRHVSPKSSERLRRREKRRGQKERRSLCGCDVRREHRCDGPRARGWRPSDDVAPWARRVIASGANTNQAGIPRQTVELVEPMATSKEEFSEAGQ
jgi:hypothetical protein